MAQIEIRINGKFKKKANEKLLTTGDEMYDFFEGLLARSGILEKELGLYINIYNEKKTRGEKFL